MQTETTIDNRGRKVAIIVSSGTPFAKVASDVQLGEVLDWFTADELRELADAMDALDG